MDRWEYMIADLTKIEKDITELNRLGAEGWEAVGMVATWGASGFRFVHPIALLKRPLQESGAFEGSEPNLREGTL